MRVGIRIAIAWLRAWPRPHTLPRALALSPAPGPYLFLEAGRPQVRAHLLKVILVTLARTFEAHASLAVEAVHFAVDRVHCGVRRMAAFEDVRLLDFVEARRDDSGEADEEQQEETREQSDTEHDVAGDDCPFDPIGAVILDRNLEGQRMVCGWRRWPGSCRLCIE
jgi:hypothetical protein